VGKEQRGVGGGEEEGRVLIYSMFFKPGRVKGLYRGLKKVPFSKTRMILISHCI